MQNATIKAEELANISSYQTLRGQKLEKLLTAYQLWALMSAHFLTSFLGDW
jgi:hypothetical protein